MTINDINDVKAGEWELVTHQWDEITSKPGEPFDFVRHRRGDVVTLDVAEAKRLWLAGAVVEPGARERAALEQARQAYELALANLPAELRDEVLKSDAAVLVDGLPASRTGEPERPNSRAKKDEWVDYAVAKGLDRKESEALTLPALKDLFSDETGDDDVTPPSGDGDKSEGDVDSASPGGNEDSTEGTPDGESSNVTNDAGLKPLPIKTAGEDAWIEAAVDRGYTREQAQAYSTQELIELLS